MTVLKAPAGFTHELPHARFCSLATPSRGTRENSIWRVWLAPGGEAAPHSLSREEIFVVLSGAVLFSSAQKTERAAVGDAIVVAPETEFTLAADHASGAELLCCLPVGGEARLQTGEPFTPPWAR